MTMQILSYIMALSFGFLLGLFYFGALWLTVRRLARMRRPYFLIFISFLLRLSILVAAFYLILSWGDWRHLLACVVGFVLARIFMTRRLGTKPQLSPSNGGQ